MTTEAGAGATTTGPASTTGADGAGASGGAAWYESFKSADLRTHPGMQRFADPEALAQSYVNLEKRFGVPQERRLDLPEDTTNAEAMRPIWERLGAPTAPEGYKLALPDGAPETDKALVGEFSSKAHELGLPVAAGQQLLKWFVDKAAAQREAEAAAFQAQAEAGRGELQKEFGAAYEGRLGEVARLVQRFGDPALAKELDAKGVGNYPNLTRMLVKLIDATMEPGFAGGLGGEAAGADRALTPTQAAARVRELGAHPALTNPTHPDHKRIVAERNKAARIAAGMEA